MNDTRLLGAANQRSAQADNSKRSKGRAVSTSPSKKFELSKLKTRPYEARKAKFKADVEITVFKMKNRGDRSHAGLVIYPRDRKGGVWLSRFYLLVENSDQPDGDVSHGGWGPVGNGKEWENPSTMDVGVAPTNREGKRTLDRLFDSCKVTK